MNIMLFLLILFCASYAVINVCVANATIIFRNNDVLAIIYINIAVLFDCYGLSCL